MSVSTIPVEDAIASMKDLQPLEPSVDINFFETFGTSGCLLNCETERTLESILKQQKDIQNPKTRQSRKQVRSMRNKHISEYRRSRQDWFSASMINASAERGCGSCLVLRDIIRIIFTKNEQDLSDEYEYSVAQYFDIRQRRVNGKELLMSIKLFQPRNRSGHFEWMSKSEFLIGKHQSMTYIRDWLQECLSDHAICAAQSTPPDESCRPARLLDLSPAQPDGSWVLKLINTVSGNSYQYACLSHRWDELIELCRTTSDNLAERMEYLNLELLPTNFRDAVAIARHLQIPYLWIDSLCIIQSGDGGQEKLQELAKMGSIYQYAQLTIAAVSSKDASQGCFINDNWRDVCLVLTDTADKAHLVGARVLDGKGQPATTKQVNDHYPLLTRGWVFQERLLSTRLLLCNYGEFTFECHQSTQCECKSGLAPHAGGNRPEKGKHKSKRHLSFSRHRRRLLRMTEQETMQGNQVSHASIDYVYWHTIVTQYMELDLTYSTDVLPAMAGCARLCELVTGQKYVAGLWSGNLFNDLLWQVEPQKRWRYLRRPADSTAPSWSWASVSMGQTITWMGVDNFKFHRRGSPLLRHAILEVCCDPESVTNPLGRLKTAYLRLRSTLYPWYLRFTCTNRSKYENPTTLYHSNMDLHVKRKGRELTCSPQIPELDIPRAAIGFSADANLWDAGLVIEPFSQCLYTPPVCKLTSIYLLPALRQGTIHVFLILVRAPSVDNKPNCYRRIGISRVVTEDTDNARSWDDMVRDYIKPQEEELWLF